LGLPECRRDGLEALPVYVWADNEQRAGRVANSLTDGQKAEIAKRLGERGVRSQCPMCGHDSFVLADGYFIHSIQPNLGGGLVLGGPSVPTVAIVCSKCGFVSQHAVGVLGLLPSKKEEVAK
jgi:hypothetical protein